MFDKNINKTGSRQTEEVSGYQGQEITDFDLSIDTEQKNEVEEETKGKDDSPKVSIGQKHCLPVIRQRVAKIGQQRKGQGCNKNQIPGHDTLIPISSINR